MLGFDSASIYTFHFNLYKMKNFGISENFILMDDDYFIGGELNKSDFFYEENGTIFPALVTSDYYEINKKVLQDRMNLYLVQIQIMICMKYASLLQRHLVKERCRHRVLV